jgi:Tfp pilus assembly protein PilN
VSHRLPSLHIEWSPGYVRAVNAATGQSAAGPHLADLGSILSGHKDVLVGVGRSVAFLKAVRLPKATPEDLRRILSVQIGQMFPLPPDQLAFDFYQTHDHDANGWLTIVAAMRSQDLEQLRTELQQVGLRAVRVMPVALGSAVIAKHAGTTDALVVEGTPTALTLDVVQGGVVRFSRTAPPGSDPATEAKRTLAAAEAGDLPIVSAGGVLLSEAAPARDGTAIKLLDAAPTFAFERTEDRLRAEAKRVAARTRFAALMMAAALLLAGLVWVERNDAQAVVTRSQGTWARELSKLRSIRDADTAKAQRVLGIQSGLKTAFEPAQPLSDIAAYISDNLPASVWLTGLNIERGKPIQIRGTAAQSSDVASLVDTLGGSARFRDVRLVFANSARIEEKPIVQFSITATAVGNLPMPAPVKTKKGRAASSRTSGSARTGTTTTGASEAAR